MCCLNVVAHWMFFCCMVSSVLIAVEDCNHRNSSIPLRFLVVCMHLLFYDDFCYFAKYIIDEKVWWQRKISYVLFECCSSLDVFCCMVSSVSIAVEDHNHRNSGIPLRLLVVCMYLLFYDEFYYFAKFL